VGQRYEILYAILSIILRRTLSAACFVLSKMTVRLVNGELERIWKEAVVAKYELLS
jgi:hypothetical protein